MSGIIRDRFKRYSDGNLESNIKGRMKNRGRIKKKGEKLLNAI